MKVYFFILAFLFASFVNAQKLEVNLQPNEILIGQQSELSIKATYSSETLALFPVFDEEIQDKIEIVKMLKPDTAFSEDKSEITLLHRYIITCFDSGFYEISPFQVAFTSGADTIFKQNNPLFFAVNTIPVDTMQGYRDIKEPVDLPIHWTEFLPYIGIALAAILIIILVIYLLKKRKKQEQLQPETKEPEIPDYEIALSKLEQIKAEKIWQNGKLKEYYVSISEVLREFIELRYKIPAPEYTSDEILKAIQTKLKINGLYNQLMTLLTLSDLAKFAKYTPNQLENENAINEAIEFVKKHIHQSETNENKESEQ